MGRLWLFPTANGLPWSSPFIRTCIEELLGSCVAVGVGVEVFVGAAVLRGVCVAVDVLVSMFVAVAAKVGVSVGVDV